MNLIETNDRINMTSDQQHQQKHHLMVIVMKKLFV